VEAEGAVREQQWSASSFDPLRTSPFGATEGSAASMEATSFCERVCLRSLLAS
jgi:hypothetical protein